MSSMEDMEPVLSKYPIDDNGDSDDNDDQYDNLYPVRSSSSYLGGCGAILGGGEGALTALAYAAAIVLIGLLMVAVYRWATSNNNGNGPTAVAVGQRDSRWNDRWRGDHRRSPGPDRDHDRHRQNHHDYGLDVGGSGLYPRRYSLY